MYLLVGRTWGPCDLHPHYCDLNLHQCFAAERAESLYHTPPPGFFLTTLLPLVLRGGTWEGCKLDTQAGLGGTHVSLGRSGPWYLALQVCPVQSGALPTPSSSILPSTPPIRATRPIHLSPWNPLPYSMLRFLTTCLPVSIPFFLCLVQSCSLWQ